MIVRVEKTNNYTVMSNYHLRDKSLSLKAKGLLSLMLSLPDDWEYSISGLCAINKEGETAIRSALTELEQNHYIERNRVYENGKIVDWEYVVYETPNGSLVVENQQQGFQQLHSHAQINTNKQNTNKQNDISKDISGTTEFQFGKPSTKTPKRTNSSEYEKAIALVENYSSNQKLVSVLKQFVSDLKEIKGKNRYKFYSSTIKNYLDELSEVCTNDLEKIEAVKLSMRYNYTTKVMKPNGIKQDFSVKRDIEMIPDSDYDNLDHNKSTRSF